MEHDKVNQAAVVGVPDDTTGTAVVLYLTTEEGARETDMLRNEIRESVGREQGKPFRPSEVLFVDTFLKTQSGKIIRRAVKTTYIGRDPSDMSSIENPEALTQIKTLGKH